MKLTERKHVLAALAGWVLLVGAVAWTGSIASLEAPAFYAALVKPSWAPPPGVFGPVWSVLYVLMAVAAWLIWKAPDQPGRKAALTVFVVQLVLNALWSWLFFAWRSGAGAMLDIVVLLAALVTTIVLFWRIRTLAGALLLPYLAWVTFATALTWAVWRGNPALL